MQHNRRVYVDYVEVNSKSRWRMYESRSADKPAETTNGFFSAKFYLRTAAESRYFAKTRLRYISSLPQFNDHNAQERRWNERKKKSFAQAIAWHSFPHISSSLIFFYPLNHFLDRGWWSDLYGDRLKENWHAARHIVSDFTRNQRYWCTESDGKHRFWFKKFNIYLRLLHIIQVSQWKSSITYVTEWLVWNMPKRVNFVFKREKYIIVINSTYCLISWKILDNLRKS